VSIIRIGLAETKNFSEGYDAIFGKKKSEKISSSTQPTPSAKAKITPKKNTKKK